MQKDLGLFLPPNNLGTPNSGTLKQLYSSWEYRLFIHVYLVWNVHRFLKLFQCSMLEKRLESISCSIDILPEHAFTIITLIRHCPRSQCSYTTFIPFHRCNIVAALFIYWSKATINLVRNSGNPPPLGGCTWRTCIAVQRPAQCKYQFCWFLQVSKRKLVQYRNFQKV